jgi:hypothetical protein
MERKAIIRVSLQACDFTEVSCRHFCVMDWPSVVCDTDDPKLD